MFKLMDKKIFTYLILNVNYIFTYGLRFSLPWAENSVHLGTLHETLWSHSTKGLRQGVSIPRVESGRQYKLATWML